jgi:hypothetical protein
MKREKIIEILDEQEFYELMQFYRFAPIDNLSRTIMAFNDVKKYIADEIMALPLDVPSDEEIQKTLLKKYPKEEWSDYHRNQIFSNLVKLRAEIIKRNK